MCTQTCQIGGCIGSLAWLLIGFGVGKRCSGNANDAWGGGSCGGACGENRGGSGGNRRCGTCTQTYGRCNRRQTCGGTRCTQEADCYYARQYALYPFDRSTCTCGGTTTYITD